VFLVITIEDIGHVVENAIRPLKNAFKAVVGLLTDPWEQINSEITDIVMTQSVTHLTAVSGFYNTPPKHYCMVLGTVSHCDIICAHIWPKHTNGNGLEAFGLSPIDVNNPRNFLRLHRTIEKAFDHKRIHFELSEVEAGPPEKIVLIVRILDNSILDEEIKISNEIHYMRELKDRIFDFKFLSTNRPFTRLIAIHAKNSISKALSAGWIDDIDYEARKARAFSLARLSLGENASTFF
jgi:hypothetical protein